MVHLTMYGERFLDREEEIKSREKILVVIGAEKVPGELYGLADYNIGITSQPHSEISSLAVFLDHLFSGEELGHEFSGAAIRVVPSPLGKHNDES